MREKEEGEGRRDRKQKAREKENGVRKRRDEVEWGMLKTNPLKRKRSKTKMIAAVCLGFHTISHIHWVHAVQIVWGFLLSVSCS